MAVSKSAVVVLTRSTADNQHLRCQLEQKHIHVLEVPCIDIAYLDFHMPDDIITTWVFTSKHGVRGFLRHERALSVLQKKQSKIAAIGDATADVLRQQQIKIDIQPQQAYGRELLNELLAICKTDQQICIVRGNLQAIDYKGILRSNGFSAIEIQTFENKEPHNLKIEQLPIAAIFIASPSAGKRLLQNNHWLQNEPFYVIGETTAQSLKELGVSNITIMGTEQAAWLTHLEQAYRSMDKEGNNEYN